MALEVTKSINTKSEVDGPSTGEDFLNGHHNDKEIQDKSVDGLCHEFEYSILFFLVVAVIGFSFTIYVILLVTKRRNFIFYGFDILYSLLFLSAAIRFSVKLWQATTIHGHKIASQSGCKLIAYTNFGMAHVISYLLLALVIYAYKGMKAADFAHLDHGIKKNLGWIVCSLFAIEGVFGMVPAIYMDVSTDGANCNSTQTLTMSVEAFVSAHMFFQSIFPYLLPFILMTYPIYQLIRNYKSIISDDFDRDIVRNIIIISTSYMAIYTPLALLAIIIFPTILHGGQIHWESLCVVEGILRFMQDVWYISSVFVLIIGDSELRFHQYAVHFIMKRFKNNSTTRGEDEATNSDAIATTFYNLNPEEAPEQNAIQRIS